MRSAGLWWHLAELGSSGELNAEVGFAGVLWEVGRKLEFGITCVRRCNISCPLYGCAKRYVAFQSAGACNALGLRMYSMYSMYRNMLCHCNNLTMLSWGASVAQATLSQSRHTSLPVHRCL